MAYVNKEVVAVEGTENAIGNNSEVRRFFEAQGETSPSLSIYKKYVTIEVTIMAPLKTLVAFRGFP